MNSSTATPRAAVLARPLRWLALSLAACDADLESVQGDGEAQGHSGAHQEILIIYWAFHGSILAQDGPRYTSPSVTR